MAEAANHASLNRQEIILLKGSVERAVRESLESGVHTIILPQISNLMRNEGLERAVKECRLAASSAHRSSSASKKSRSPITARDRDRASVTASARASATGRVCARGDADSIKLLNSCFWFFFYCVSSQLHLSVAA